MPTPYRPTLTSALALLLLSGCAKKEAAPPPAAAAPPPPPALAVASLTLGSAITEAKTVPTATTTLHPTDTIYVSVATTGVGTGSLGAVWSWVRPDGSTKSVNETAETITTTGSAATEFHIAKATPWPKGHYRVVIQFNGAAADSSDFQVQ